MNTNTMTTIEINGVKMEVDLRHAKRVDELRVGDRVKVLIKDYSDYKVFAGTIIGFEPFGKLPTVIVAYLKNDYSGADIQFLYFNAQSKETEMVKAIDDDCLDIDKGNVLDKFASQIEQKKREIQDIETKRDYFLRQFRKYWEPISMPEPENS